MSALPDTTAVRAGNVGAQPGAATAIARRANILTLTQAAEDAVLTPQQTGAFSHAMRAALAARMARLNGEDAVAKTFEARAAGSDAARLADPSHDGEGTAHAALLAFVDKTTAAPKDIAAGDIAALKASGMADADIVRLCELIAFLAYELRLVAGLKLLAGRPS